VNEENGTIKGAISIFPGEEEKLLEKNIGKYGKELAQIMGFFAVVKMIFRSSLNKILPTINDDELYIQALAVFPRISRSKNCITITKACPGLYQTNKINQGFAVG